MGSNEKERMELELLLETVWKCHGQDFRSYALASTERRVRRLMLDFEVEVISDLIPLLIHHEKAYSKFLERFQLPGNEMFRDPFVFRSLRETVLPSLHTYPSVKVWNAGCSTGEEVYSLAILLTEDDFYKRTTIFATDASEASLAQGRKGVYPAKGSEHVASNYHAAGGTKAFEDYFRVGSASISAVKSLRERITFANHNLVTDGVFGEMQVIICRNVLLYFDQPLQERVLELFDQSLSRGGYLCLGVNEAFLGPKVADSYELVDRKANIFRKKFQ